MGMGISKSKEQVMKAKSAHHAYRIGDTQPSQMDGLRVTKLRELVDVDEETVWGESGLRFRFSVSLEDGWWLLSMRGGTVFKVDTLVLLTPLDQESPDLLRGCIRSDSKKTYYVFRITATEKQLLASYNHSNKERKFMTEEQSLMEEASEMLKLYFPDVNNKSIPIKDNFCSWGFLRHDLAFIIKSQTKAYMELYILTTEEEIEYEERNKQIDDEDEVEDED